MDGIRVASGVVVDEPLQPFLVDSVM